MGRRVLCAGVVLSSALVCPPATSAQAAYELLYRFRAGAKGPIGRLAEGPDGSLYGMTYLGGRFYGGTIFALRPSAGGFSTEIVHEFQMATDGALPWGSLIRGTDGNFYGLTTTNAPPVPSAQGGTVFRMTPSGEFSVLHAFSIPGEGRMPVWRLHEASDGNFYGSTCGAEDSTVFRITPTGSYTPLFKLPITFPPVHSYARGVCPVTELTEGPDGRLYGEATYAGAYYPVPYGGGTLFSIDPSDSAPERFALHALFDGTNGAQPVGGLVAGPGGALVGTTYEGGAHGKGTIFRREPDGALTVVHAFAGPDGARPYGALLRGTDGNFYGTASEGGAGFGTLFRIDAEDRLTTLHSFTGTDGRAPVELMEAQDGSFYGVTYYDGAGGGGTAFRWSSGGVLETLHAFSFGPTSPRGVIEASDGNLYGTTHNSAFGGGTVFRLSRVGELAVVHEFPPAPHQTGPLSVYPSGLIQASDGFLYGTTEYGGSDDAGTVFRVGTAGGYTLLHSFMGSSQWRPRHGVTRASDGFFYGTTGDHGTVFRMDASGNFTTLHSFPEGQGSEPSGPLVESEDGSLYGTTAAGGSFGVGSVFKVTPSGAFTLVHSFSGGDGRRPTGGLARAEDGRLYGVTVGGGAAGHGTLFRVEAPGGVATLHDFAESEGYPGALVGGRDGALYGVASTDPLFASPTLFFRFTAAGLETLYATAAADGMAPSRPIQGKDGALYGTMSFGEGFQGGIFRFTLPADGATPGRGRHPAREPGR